MKRIYFKRYDSSGKFPDNRIKLDVHFRSSDDQEYVWTPDWKGTRQFFIEAYRIEQINVPGSSETVEFKKAASEVVYDEEQKKGNINYKLIALKIGEELKNQTTLNQIGRMASAVFDFDIVPHPHNSITSSRSQEIYSWIMTLSERPVSEQKKVCLLKEFISSLAPKDSPSRNILSMSVG
jgi:hypothetical protein